MTPTRIPAAGALFLIVLAACSACRRIEAQELHHIPRFDFKGKLLVIACDTDMAPSAYIDGNLGPAAGPDVLSVIRLNQPLTRMYASTVEVTNSVVGPPASITATPDGRYAIVAETLGPRPAGKPEATMKDLAPGKKITVVDLANPDRPKVVQQITSHEHPVSVAVNAAGTLIAVTFASSGASQVPLVLYHFDKGMLTAPSEPKLPGFTSEDRLSDAEFLPGKDVLGVVYTSDRSSTNSHPRLSLLEFADTDEQVTLTPWGNALELDPSPFMVKFTPDGRFAIVNSMHVFASGRGTVTSIQLAARMTAQGIPQHVIVSHVDAGELPEGLAISPNGRWVATANLENSTLPLSDPDQQFFASLSLFRLEPASGRIERIGEFPFDGLLPEPIVFDNSSYFIAAGSFGRYDDPKAGGSINFWRIVDRTPQPGRVELVRLNESIPVARGPQSMVIVR